MRNLYTIFGIIMLLAFTSCNTVRVSSDYDRNADFSQYKTFAFHQKGLADLKMNDLDKRRIVEAIGTSLTSKGMTMASAETNADLVINLAAKSKTRVNVDPYYDPWWGGPYWGASQRVSQYKEGSIILDFIDRRKNTLVWQGIGEGLNVSDIENKATKIPLAVEEILEKYPPKRK